MQTADMARQHPASASEKLRLDVFPVPVVIPGAFRWNKPLLDRAGYRG